MAWSGTLRGAAHLHEHVFDLTGGRKRGRHAQLKVLISVESDRPEFPCFVSIWTAVQWSDIYVDVWSWRNSEFSENENEWMSSVPKLVDTLGG